jgi:hypothetical protein
MQTANTSTLTHKPKRNLLARNSVYISSLASTRQEARGRAELVDSAFMFRLSEVTRDTVGAAYLTSAKSLMRRNMWGHTPGVSAVPGDVVRAIVDRMPPLTVSATPDMLVLACGVVACVGDIVRGMNREAFAAAEAPWEPYEMHLPHAMIRDAVISTVAMSVAGTVLTRIMHGAGVHKPKGDCLSPTTAAQLWARRICAISELSTIPVEQVERMLGALAAERKPVPRAPRLGRLSAAERAFEALVRHHVPVADALGGAPTPLTVDAMRGVCLRAGCRDQFDRMTVHLKSPRSIDLMAYKHVMGD